jgi:anti-anti-sigma factor
VPEIGQIIVEHTPGASIVALCGEHDISTAPAVQTELDAILATESNLVVDLTEATFIDSSIVRLIYVTSTNTTPARAVAVAAPPDSMPRRLFETLALPDAVLTFDTRGAAVSYLQDGSAQSA